jgi:uncharacterized membrane protein
MVRNEYLQKLEAALRDIPDIDRKDMVYDFEEHFTMGLENGKTEEEIIEELGDPTLIAKDLISDYLVSKDRDHTAPKITRIVLSSIGLGFFNLVFILGPVAGLCGIYVGLCATAISFTLSPLLAVYSALIGDMDGISFEIFASLILCGVGILLSVGMLYVGKYLYKVILKYIQFNIKVIMGDQSL